MTTLQILTFLGLTSTSLLAMIQQTPQSNDQPVAIPIAGHTVAIVKVKAPWYGFDFLLAREFHKVIPTYQKINGLRFKAFSSTETKEGKFFGGIYLWDSERVARDWYTPNWFADVEQKRGQKPTVTYFPVLHEATFVSPDFDYRQQEDDCITVFAHAINLAGVQQCFTKQPGLLRVYLVGEPRQQQGAILLFASVKEAQRFVNQQPAVRFEWFKTSVLLNNVKP